MAERIENLPENALHQMLNNAEKLANELKSRQLVSGGNIRFYTSDTGNQYDWEGALPAGGQSAGSGSKILRVIATAQNMDNLFADIIVEIYDGNGNLWTAAELKENMEKSVQPQFDRVQYEEAGNISESNKRKWIVGVMGLAGQYAKIKVYVVASDEVAITFEVVN